MKKLHTATVAIGITLALAACSQSDAQTDDTAAATEAEQAASDADTSEDGEAAEPVAFKMDELSCWDLTTSGEEEQAFAATLVYGYVSGVAGANEQSSEGITSKIGTAVEYCIENPDATAVEAFSQESE